MKRDDASFEAAQSRGIQSVEVAFRLLGPFMQGPGPFTLTSLAQAADMAPSKAAFYLRSLVKVGILARADRSYFLGPSALQLGLSALAQIDVVEAAQPALHQLRDTIALPLFLSVWAEQGPTVVQHLNGPRSSSWTMRVGAVLPALSATGRAFLAYSEPGLQTQTIDRALADAKVNDPWFGHSRAMVIEMLRDVRRTGISPRSGAIIPGYGSIAAAIIGPNGEAAAAITVISDLAALGDLDEFAPALLSATQDISQLIGGTRR